jgi:hypothetical protein
MYNFENLLAIPLTFSVHYRIGSSLKAEQRTELAEAQLWFTVRMKKSLVTRTNFTLKNAHRWVLIYDFLLPMSDIRY